MVQYYRYDQRREKREEERRTEKKQNLLLFFSYEGNASICMNGRSVMEAVDYEVIRS
jgi:hypothetical protein